MGVGFVLGGYCPGTSFCGAAVGRIDAMAFAAGGFLGIFAFGEAFPFLQNLYKAGSKGDLLVSTALGISEGHFAAIMIAVAVGAFIVTTRIEKKINPESGAFRFPAAKHRAAGALLLAVAVVLFAVPDRKARLMARVRNPEFVLAHPVRLMAADELAIHILDRDSRIQLVDVREATDFNKATLPGAVNVTTAALFGKEGQNTLQGSRVLKVFFARDEAGGIAAAELAAMVGVDRVAALEGGLDRFTAAILSAPGKLPMDVDGETAAFRARAGTEIAALIKQQSGPKPVKTIRRVQGGCGG